MSMKGKAVVRPIRSNRPAEISFHSITRGLGPGFFLASTLSLQNKPIDWVA